MSKDNINKKQQEAKIELPKGDLLKKVIMKMESTITQLAQNYLQDQLKSQFEYLQPFFLENIQNIKLPQPTKENFNDWKISLNAKVIENIKS